MEADQGHAARQNQRPWRHRQGQSAVCRSGAVDCPHRVPLARPGPGVGQLACDVYALLALEQKGVWARVIEAVNDDADLEVLFIDSTAVRAHQHAAGAQKKKATKRSGARAGD